MVSQEAKIEVVADRGRCLGSGNCFYSDPEVFDQSEQDGIVIVVNPNPSDEHRDAVLLAANLCPGQAISVRKV